MNAILNSHSFLRLWKKKSKVSSFFIVHQYDEDTQQTFTCSKPTIETLKKHENCPKLTIKVPERCDIGLLSLLLILNIFLNFF